MDFPEIERYRSQLQVWPGPVPVVVDAYYVNGLGVIRSLASAGLRSLALSKSAYGLGGASRYALGMTCPDPSENPQEFVDFMEQLGRAMPEKGILLITEDTCLEVLDAARGRLEPYFRYSFSGGVIPRIQDKWEQIQAAMRCGVPVPRTVIFDREAVLAEWRESDFPALVKGRRGKGFCYASGRQVILVRDRREAAAVLRQYGRYELLLQEIVPGGDGSLINLGIYASQVTGLPLGAFCFRKLTTVPPIFGVARVAESETAPHILRYGNDLLAEFNFTGAAHIEFRRDPRDGQDKLIEINPRFWLSNIHAAACGVNMPLMLYQESTGQPVLPVLAYPDGHRYLLAWYEIVHLFDPPGFGPNLRELRRTLRSPHVDPLASWRDPLPGLMYLFHHVREWGRKPKSP